MFRFTTLLFFLMWKTSYLCSNFGGITLSTFTSNCPNPPNEYVTSLWETL